MVSLDDKAAIALIDKSNTYASVVNLSKQCKQAWEETQHIVFLENYRNVQNITLCGMGGSAYAAYFIKALFSKKLPLPFALVNGYDIPAYINEKSLVLLSSYSGSTEEILTCAKAALARGAKLAAVASGSHLEAFAKTNNLPAYIFNPLHNPAKQPRLGQGYMILGHMGLLARLGFLPLTTPEVTEAISFLEEQNETIEKQAKNIASELVEKIPVIVAAEHLAGNAHALRNQFNETGKSFASYSLIPELNHHLMEGLVHPQERILTFLMFRSALYSPVVQKRFALTKNVLAKNNMSVVNAQIEGKTTLSQALYTLSLGGYITFYLAILYKKDPSLIPWVDYFKQQLQQSSL